MNTQEPPATYSIHFDDVLQAVIMRWQGYATSVEFREGTELMLDMLKLNHANKVLADIEEMAIIGMDDQAWLNSDFLPRAIASGFRAIAIIRPHAYFNKVAVESISYKVDKEKLAIAFFDNKRSAREWLEAKSEK
jgi:hypothetical protein